MKILKHVGFFYLLIILMIIIESVIIGFKISAKKEIKNAEVVFVGLKEKIGGQNGQGK